MPDSCFSIGPQGIYYILQDASQRAGLGKLAPHDLRRTGARLAREGGASLEQISMVLGHSSIATTERYLGSRLEMNAGKAAFDYIRLPEAQTQKKTETAKKGKEVQA